MNLTEDDEEYWNIYSAKFIKDGKPPRIANQTPIVKS